MQGIYRNNRIYDEIKQSFKEGSYLTKLIYINLGVFVLLGLNYAFVRLTGGSAESDFYLGKWLVLPSYVPELLHKPWTLISYMFVHELTYRGGFFHIFFNILVLYWFGKIFLVYLDQKKLLSIYLMGGIVGGLMYVAAFNLIPSFEMQALLSTNRGASGAIMAIVFAISFFKPDYEVFMLFIGRVKLKYIAIGYILIDLLGLGSDNAGGHFAHLGGALYGFLYISQYKKGRTIMKGFDKILDGLFTLFKPRSKKRFKVSYNKPPVNDLEYNAYKVQKQEEIDKILDKISKFGYDSLSGKEKEILFKQGKR